MTSDKKPAPRVYWLKKSCDPKFEYWDTEVSIAEKPDEDFQNADPFVEKVEYDQLAAELEEHKKTSLEAYSALDDINIELNKKLQERDQVRLWNENEQLRAKIEIYEKYIITHRYLLDGLIQLADKNKLVLTPSGVVEMRDEIDRTLKAAKEVK